MAFRQIGEKQGFSYTTAKNYFDKAVSKIAGANQGKRMDALEGFLYLSGLTYFMVFFFLRNPRPRPRIISEFKRLKARQAGEGFRVAFEATALGRHLLVVERRKREAFERLVEKKTVIGSERPYLETSLNEVRNDPEVRRALAERLDAGIGLWRETLGFAVSRGASPEAIQYIEQCIESAENNRRSLLG